MSDGYSLIDFVENALSAIISTHAEGKQHNPIALIIVDINMPEMTGLECVKTIRYKFNDINERLKRENICKGKRLINTRSLSNSESKVIVHRPLICYYSESSREIMS